MTDDERLRHDRLRSDGYRLLSACFYPPDRDQLLRERTCLELAAALNELYPEAEAGGHAAALHDELSRLSELDLRVDHAALFVGPFALKAPPYGSVYLEENHALMGNTTMAAADCYARAGLTLTLREPADHIAVELEFMQYLAARAVQATDAGNRETAAGLADEQLYFLTEHLGAWAPAFSGAVKQGAQTRFYRILADCLTDFLDAELRQSSAGLVSTV